LLSPSYLGYRKSNSGLPTLERKRVELYLQSRRRNYLTRTTKPCPVIRDEDDASKYMQERYAEARAYLDLTDQTKAIEDLTPFAKQYCFYFFCMFLDSKHPPLQMTYLDLWYDFGYVRLAAGKQDQQGTEGWNHALPVFQVVDTVRRRTA